VVVALLVVAVVGTTAPAVALDPVPYFVDEAKLPFEPLPGHEAADRRWGVLRGAGYRIEVPADWNGDLVLFAHGYRGTGLELTVSNPALRPHLLDRGYAWAASSYATNGYDPGQGALDTAALAHRFAGLVERPTRTYVVGQSMGGHVTAAAIERYPFMFDGAMPMCGVLGDLELFDYFLDYNVVAEALSGVEVPFPPPPDYATAYGPRVAVELGSPFPTELDAQGEALKAVTRQISGGDRPGFDGAFVQWATFLLGRGNAFSDNVDTVYQLDADPEVSEAEAALNASVARHEGAELTAEQIQQYAPLDADIYVPTLSLHTLGDLYVPFAM
jgi:pimeloyl-ACP methyl ester carboxylesterase